MLKSRLPGLRSKGKWWAPPSRGARARMFLPIFQCCNFVFSLGLWLCFAFSLQIAIKILNKRAASNEYLTKFLPREMKILMKIRHENIIQTHGIVETEKYTYFMLELAANGDLLDYINARRFIPEPEARHIFIQMGSAIAYCHALGIVHRDLKCENIMLSKDMDVKVGGMCFTKLSWKLFSLK